MPFPHVPNQSKGEVNRAGQTLASQKPETKEYQDALEIVNAWRVCHAYPLNTFRSTLQRKVRKYKNALTAQRLKRLPTIIDKLNRYPDMSLARMQDIGGARAIVNSIKEVRELQAQYEDKDRFTHELVRKDDYILNPKKDGYRGIHLVFRYNNTLARNETAKEYKGLLVELQLRTKLQHTWATAVETAGTFKGEGFKSQKGSKHWLEFFSLVSSAFAYAENTPPVPGLEKLSAKETYKKIADIEKRHKLLEQLRGLSVAVRHIDITGYSGHYNLIILNPTQHSVQIKPYKKEDLALASRDYAAAEAKAEKDKTEPVLVSAGSLKSLKQAYPNYFLDIRDFIEKIENIIKVSKE